MSNYFQRSSLGEDRPSAPDILCSSAGFANQVRKAVKIFVYDLQLLPCHFSGRSILIKNWIARFNFGINPLL